MEKEDVRVDVTSTGCRVSFVTELARRFALKNFDSVRPLNVDVWHGGNVIKAIQAEGMTVTPGATEEIERVKQRRLGPYWVPSAGDRSSALSLADVATPATSAESSEEPLEDLVASLRRELRFLRGCAALLVSLLLGIQMVHVMELALSGLREWLQA